MNILQEILQAQGGQVVEKLASQFGLDGKDAKKALSNLIPAVAGGIKKTASSTSGLEGLLSKVLNNQELRKSMDSPDILADPKATHAGNEMLSDIFGSKDVSRTVAKQTAQSTGIDLDILKKMLPLVAGLVMSSLNKHGESDNNGLGGLLNSLGGAAKSQQTSSGGLAGLLGGLFGKKQNRSATPTKGGLESLLDFDGDGNVTDDVLDLVKKLF